MVIKPRGSSSGWPSPLGVSGPQRRTHRCPRWEKRAYATPHPCPTSPAGERRASGITSPLQVFHVAYVLVKFANSPRPDLWVLERSVDFGQTYQPWQFFACKSPGAQGWQACPGRLFLPCSVAPSFCAGQDCWGLSGSLL